MHLHEHASHHVHHLDQVPTSCDCHIRSFVDIVVASEAEMIVHRMTDTLLEAAFPYPFPFPFPFVAAVVAAVDTCRLVEDRVAWASALASAEEGRACRHHIRPSFEVALAALVALASAWMVAWGAAYLLLVLVHTYSDDPIVAAVAAVVADIHLCDLHLCLHVHLSLDLDLVVVHHAIL